MPAARTLLLALLLLALAPAMARAADITTIGSQVRLTKVGNDGDAAIDANNPAVAYNSTNDEYLVVWVGRLSSTAENEILGQILDGNGAPKGSVQALSSVPDDELAPTQPVVGYSPKVNQYVLGYIATPQVITPAPANSPDGQRELIAQVVTATGVRTGPPARISDTDAGDADPDSASDPAVAYDPEHDTFRFVWIAASGTDDTNQEVRTQAVSSALVTSSGIELNVSTTDGSPDEPAIAYLPTQDRFMVAWEAPSSTGFTTIFARPVSTIGIGVVAQAQVAEAAVANGSVLKPSIAANPGRNEALISFLKQPSTTDGVEVFVQRVSAGGAQVPTTADQRISAIGPATPNLAFNANTSRITTTTYHPDLDRYLVTWDADVTVDNEFERYGQALTGDGAEVGSNDFRITFTGADGTTSVSPLDADTVAVAGKRAWLTVWDADDNRSPLADNEFEIYGRFTGDDGDLDGFTAPDDCDDANAAAHPGATDVLDNSIDENCDGVSAENLDRDADGSLRPADCNDANAGIRPGAADAADNGVDEDCNGADSVNLDRDGDGSLRPGDCNDGNRNIRPGAFDIPRNRIDEDCSGADAPFPNLTSGVLPTWDVRGSRLTLVSLQITQQFPKGIAAEIFCKGSKCPFKSKKLKLGKVRRGSASAISSLTSKQRKFRAGQTLEVWVSAPGFNTKVSRLALKKGKVPRSQPFCVIPGEKKPRRSCG